MKDIKSLPIIIWSMSRWDNSLSSAAYSLAKELSKNNDVYYIDYPFTIKEYLDAKSEDYIVKRKRAILKGEDIYTKVPGLPKRFTAVTPKLLMSVSFLPPGRLYNFLARINMRRFSGVLDKIIKDNKIKDYIFFNSFNPYYGYNVPKRFKPRFYIYQSRDDIRSYGPVAKHGLRGEVKSMEEADVIMATSTNLKRVLEGDTTKSVNLLPNGAEVSLFKTAFYEDLEKPKELQNNTKPVVGYIGHIGLRLDFEILTALIASNPDKLFLFVGPGTYEEFTEVPLKDLDNVLFVGPKPLQELPRYLKYMDCTIIPFLKNAITKSIYPLKLNEQLAAGKGIITTSFSEDLDHFEDVIYRADTAEEFSHQIEKAIAENSPEQMEKRIKHTDGNSWKDRIRLFWEILDAKK